MILLANYGFINSLESLNSEEKDG